MNNLLTTKAVNMKKEIKKAMEEAKRLQEEKFDNFEPSFDNRLLYYEMLKSSGKLKGYDIEIFRNRYHMIGTYAQRLDWSRIKVQNHYNTLFTNGQLEFVTNHIEIIRDIDCSSICELRNPNYARATLKIKDKNYRWDIKCQEIYNYIVGSEGGIKAKYFRKDQPLTEQSSYQNPKTIAKKTGLTVCEVKYRLKNVFRSIFGDQAYHKPSFEERLKRFHSDSKTNTIEVPKRIELKNIFKKITDRFHITVEKKRVGIRQKGQNIKEEVQMQVKERILNPISQKIHECIEILECLEELFLDFINSSRITKWICQKQDITLLEAIKQELLQGNDLNELNRGLKKLGFNY